MIVLINRTLLSTRRVAPQLLAALAVTAAVAGCGGSTTPPSNSTATVGATTAPAASAGATPPVAPSSGGESVDASLINAPSGSSAGSVSHQGGPQITSGSRQTVQRQAAASVSQGSGGQVTSAGPGESRITTASSGGTHKSSSGGSGAPKASTPASKPGSTTATGTNPASTPAGDTTGAAPGTRPRFYLLTIYKTRIRTRIKTEVRIKRVVRVRTVIKTVRPKVPSTAFLPSTHPVLEQTSFLLPGSNVGCRIGASSVKCSILQRVWAPPIQPAKCNATWGNTILMQGSTAATFVCGGSSAISADAKVIPDGWDDTIGKITCQIRRLGVDCFSKQHHGFVMSRTAYAVY